MEKELTYGQKLVGLTLNTLTEDSIVEDSIVKDSIIEIKLKYADIIDDLNNLRNNTWSSEIKRICSIAITEAQTSEMWAFKSLTWKD